MKTSDPVKWHPAFFQAIQLELANYRRSLRFFPEYQLTTEPLRIDVLIVKKPQDLRITRNIARIFKAENIIEYKSPGDCLSVSDFLKVYAYACLYALITEGGLSGISLTFIGSRYPRELMKYFRDVRKYGVEEAEAGIYEVRGDYLPIQVIVVRKLGAENLWLKGLGKGLEKGEVESILREGKKWEGKVRADAYFDAVLHGNPETFEEVIRMGKKLTLEDVLTEAGILPRWVEKGRQEGKEMVARNLLNRGMSVKETAETAELDLKKVRALSASLGKTGGQKRRSRV
jgi:hypothetical protein